MIKKAIRKWLVPEYGNALLRLESFLNEIEIAKEIVTAKDKDIEITGPVIFLGSLNDCKVKLNPTIKPTIVLSKFEMDSMLHFTGSHSMISHNVMSSVEKAVTLDIPEEEEGAEGK